MGVSHLNNRIVEASSIRYMNNKWNITTFLDVRKLPGEGRFTVYTSGSQSGVPKCSNIAGELVKNVNSQAPPLILN